MRHLTVLLASLGMFVAVVGPVGAAEQPEGAPVNVRVDAGAGRRPISPYIYGRNLFRFGGLDEFTPESLALVKEAGVRMLRISEGNNGTKYNWRNDLSSNPDWYNNVYPMHLHEGAKMLADQTRDLQVLASFQVLGWVAKTDQYNFNEAQANPRPDPRQNLCGGGKPELYLQPWTAKDTVDILDHWFGAGGLGLDPARFHYWHMDNEPECWPSTHDDVCPKDLTAEQCVQKYVAVAREVRSRYPGIRLMAPGFTSEWQWWNWADNKAVDGMPWMQYFVKRMAEESRAAGKPLIDVVDFHTYVSGNATDEDLLQEHRIFYDAKYEFPRANGCKVFPDGGWHEDQKVELVFGRMEGWLDQYFGAGHSIGIGITEGGLAGRAPMVNALWYASMLGTYADHGVEIFTPWAWADQDWEVLHLFSRYAGDTRVEAVSSDEKMVSAYASVGKAGGRMTVILVNREKSAARPVRIAVTGISPREGEQATLTLSELAKDVRTFQTHEKNALRKGSTHIENGAFSVLMPPYSITAVLIEPAGRASSS